MNEMFNHKLYYYYLYFMLDLNKVFYNYLFYNCIYIIFETYN